MKTIKELEAEMSEHGATNHRIGYRHALKDVLGLIDEIELKEGDWCDAWFELKTKIEGK